MTYVIEKGLPIPASNKVSANEKTLAFRALEVGDSFYVPSVKVVPFYQHQKDGKKFCTRRVEGGVRVWRLA